MSVSRHNAGNMSSPTEPENSCVSYRSVSTVIQGIPNHWEFRVSRWNLLKKIQSKLLSWPVFYKDQTFAVCDQFFQSYVLLDDREQVFFIITQHLSKNCIFVICDHNHGIMQVYWDFLGVNLMLHIWQPNSAFAATQFLPNVLQKNL